MSHIPDDDARRLGANLARWAQRPVRESNLRIVAIELVLFGWLGYFAWHAQNAGELLRSTGFVVALLHVILHAFSIVGLARLRRLGVVEAGMALRSYRNPRRISNLDVAVAWVTFAVLGPMLLS